MGVCVKLLVQGVLRFLEIPEPIYFYLCFCVPWAIQHILSLFSYLLPYNSFSCKTLRGCFLSTSRKNLEGLITRDFTMLLYSFSFSIAVA